MNIMLPVFLLLSGFASLVYQVTWVRLLGLSLGSTSASISIVLSAFFLGLSLGSVLAGKIAKDRALHYYALVEAIIAICGLISLPVLLHLDSVLAVSPAIGSYLLPKLLFTFFLLLVPTTCMGATFPLVAALFVRRTEQLGKDVGSLYALNTFGAVFGAFLSGFVLLPNWGLDGAIYIAASINVLIAALAVAAVLWMAPAGRGGDVAAVSARAMAGAGQVADRIPAGITLFVTGFAAIATQVGWNKYLSIFVGSTVYGFSILLSAFLTGIALGSWFARNRIDRARSLAALMACGLFVTGMMLIITRLALTYVPEFQALLNTIGQDEKSFVVRYVTIGLVILPPTLLFGALFPLNLRIFCGGAESVHGGVGIAYAINTLASILGAIFAGFIAIPFFGTDTLLLSMALLVAGAPLVWAKSLAPNWRIAAISTPLAAALLLFWLPKLDYGRLIATVGYDAESFAGEVPDYLFLKEGKAGVIGLLTYDGTNVKLQNNGLNEAQLSLENPDDVPLVETLLGLMPYALHPSPKTAFVIGFGGGTTANVLGDTDLKDVQIVELEPAVVDAMRSIPDGPTEVLKDPRVHLRFNDARNVLIVDDRKYDLIVSQPSHPWLAGSTGVFSREFWSIARARLNDNGIFGQWVNLFRMDTTTLKSLLRAFYEVFPHGFVLANDGNVLLLGSVAPLSIDYAKMQKLIEKGGMHARMQALEISSVHDILWYFKLSRDQAIALTARSVANSDINILSEVRLARLFGEPEGKEDPAKFLNAANSMDIAPLLGEGANYKLALLAMYFQREGAFQKASLIERRLTRLDVKLARVVEHRRYLESLDYAEAINLYRRHSDWPPEAHIAQARAFMELDDLADAERALLAAGPAASVERERLDFLKGAGPQVASAGKAPTIWARLAQARSDPAGAAPELLALLESDAVSEDAKPFVYRALAKHFASVGDDARFDRVASKLADCISARVERLGQILEAASGPDGDRVSEQARASMDRLQGGGV